MNPCQWWTASPQGEIVFDCNVLLDAVCNNSQRGNWAREVIAWTGREEHKVLVAAMAHGEILAVLRKLELQQIADSRKMHPEGPAAPESTMDRVDRGIRKPSPVPIISEADARARRAKAAEADSRRAKKLAEKAGFGDYSIDFIRQARGIGG